MIVAYNLAQAPRCGSAPILSEGEFVRFGPAASIFVQAEDERTRDYIAGRFG